AGVFVRPVARPTLFVSAGERGRRREVGPILLHRGRSVLDRHLPGGSGDPVREGGDQAPGGRSLRCGAGFAETVPHSRLSRSSPLFGRGGGVYRLRGGSLHGIPASLSPRGAR